MLGNEARRRDASVLQLTLDDAARLLGKHSRGRVDEDRVAVLGDREALVPQFGGQVVGVAPCEPEALEQTAGSLFVRKLDAEAPVVGGHIRTSLCETGVDESAQSRHRYGQSLFGPLQTDRGRRPTTKRSASQTVTVRASFIAIPRTAPVVSTLRTTCSSTGEAASPSSTSQTDSARHVEGLLGRDGLHVRASNGPRW